MSYIVYTDKPKLFECNVKLEGAKIKDTVARLVLESFDYNVMFYGVINEQGDCSIPIKKLKNLMENTTGIMKLEVIAEDTYFTPWTDEFELKTSKTVQVEIKNSDNKSKIVENKKVVSVTTNLNTSQPNKQTNKQVTSSDDYVQPLLEQFKKLNATYDSILENRKTVFPIIINYFKQLGFTDTKTELTKFLKLLKQK